jgi:hypothetical protein
VAWSNAPLRAKGMPRIYCAASSGTVLEQLSYLGATAIVKGRIVLSSSLDFWALLLDFRAPHKGERKL